MKETKFIEQNKEKWLKFEQLLRLKRRDPDQLGDLFIQITDDLSYARTNYPNRSIKIYLNNLAQQLFYNIYKNKKEGRNKIIRFWRDELPSISWHCRKELLLALLVFSLAVLIGAVSAANDAQFVNTILGDQYVEQTLENIESGDPMAIYKSQGEIDMFLGISFNNVRVAFMTFITGVLFSLGSIIVLMFNGIMLGSFQYFFLERGLVAESMLTIWLHGTLEISAIIIAGAAGIVLGKGFVFPGTHSRLRAFQQSARLGIKLLIGIVPILVFAAIIESFLTRYTEAPAVIKLALIICSLAFILFYFAWIPYSKYRKGTIQPIKDSSSKADDYSIVEYNGEVQSMNEIFRDSVVLYTKIFKKYFLPAMAVCALAVVGYGIAMKGLIEGGLIHVDAFILFKVLSLLEHAENPFLFLINTLAFTALAYLAYVQTLKFFNQKVSKARVLIASLTMALFINALFFLDHVLASILFLFIFPLGLYIITVMLHEGASFSAAFSRFREFLGQSGGRMIGLYALLLFILCVFMLLIDTPFMTFYLDFVQSSFAYDATVMYYLALALNALVITLGISFILPLFIIGCYLQYHTLSEITTAKYLLEKIDVFNK